MAAMSTATVGRGVTRLPGAARRPVAVVSLPRKPMRVMANAGGVPPISGASGSSTGPSDASPYNPNITPGQTVPPTGSGYTRGTVPVGGSPGGPYSGGSGSGGSGGRPGGSGGSGGSGSGGDGGFDMNKVLLIALGVGLAIPAWRYLNTRYFFKPQPEHALAKAEDTASEIKRKNAIQKAASSVKHATVDPVRDAVHSVKHSDTSRTVQHKAEEAKDSADTAWHNTSNKAERAGSKLKKDSRQAAEDAKSKADDVASKADSKLHEAGTNIGRSLQHGKEAVSDAFYDAERAGAKATKGALENIKGAAHTVGRKLHLVADKTESKTKKAANKAERELGVDGYSSNRGAYIAGGVAIGVGTLAALYVWDRKGGDLGGKMRKLQDRTKEAADTAVGKAKDALNRNGVAQEPAGPNMTTNRTGRS